MTQVKMQKLLAIATTISLVVLIAVVFSLFAPTGTAQVSGVGFPVAAAYVSADGSIASGTSNVASAFYDAAAGHYEVTISGESYYYLDYVTLVTMSDDQPLIISTSSVNGHLVVQIMEITGRRVQADFQFVTFRP